MSADGDKETGRNDPGTRQRLLFFLMAMGVSIPGLLLGGPTVGYIAFLLFGILYVQFFSGKLRRLFLFLYLLLAVGLLVGGLAYSKLNSEAIVARISNWSLIGPLFKHLAVRAGLSVLAGLVGGALAVGLPLGLVLFVSAEWFLALRETYELDRKLAMKLLLYLALGIGEPYFIVEEGEIAMTKPKGPLDKFGRPVVAVIKPYNAIVLERSGDVTRVEGPGLVTLRKFERVKASIDLRTQGQNFEVKALTKDNVPLAVKGFIMFRIEGWKEARDRGDRGDFETKDFKGIISGPYPVYRRTLYRAVYRIRSDRDWKSQTIGLAIGRVGAAIRGFLVDEIFVVNEDERVSMEQSTLLDIAEQARTGAAETGTLWGVSITGLTIISIEMPEEAQEEFLRRWGAPWRGWQALVEARAEGEAAAILAAGKSQAMLTGGKTEAQIDKVKADAERWKIVTEAEGRRLAAEHEGEIHRIAATGQAQARREVAETDAETAVIDARGKARSRLETAKAKMERDKLAATFAREIAKIRGMATIEDSQAQAAATRIQAHAEAEAEAILFQRLAEAMLRTLDPKRVQEILEEMAKQRIDLDQMRKLVSIITPPTRALVRGQPGIREPDFEEEADQREASEEPA